MARRGRSRRRGGKGNSALGKVFAGLTITAVLGVVGFLFYLNMTSEVVKLDETTMCPIGKPPTHVYAVLIDSTEALPEKSARQAIIKFQNILNAAPMNSKITLYAVRSGNESHAMPIASVCKPDNGEAASQLTANPALIKKHYDQFIGSLNAHLESLVEQPGSNTSPIIESLQSAVIESFEGNPNADSKTIIVISDMIQNSDLYSFYRLKPDFQSYQRSSKSSGQGILSLKGIRVELLLVPRTPPTGTRQDLVRFWSEFLSEYGALSGSSLEPLS